MHFNLEHSANPGTNIQWQILHSGLPNYYTRRAVEAQYIAQIPAGLIMNGCVGIQLRCKL